VNLERGVLTISGERPSGLPAADEKAAVHVNERFAGRFRRVLSLPRTPTRARQPPTATRAARVHQAPRGRPARRIEIRYSRNEP